MENAETATMLRMEIIKVDWHDHAADRSRSLMEANFCRSHLQTVPLCLLAGRVSLKILLSWETLPEVEILTWPGEWYTDDRRRIQ